LVLGDFNRITVYDLAQPRAIVSAKLLDLSNKHVPAPSPTRQELAAISGDGRRLMILDRELNTRQEIDLGTVVIPTSDKSLIWTDDGQAVLVDAKLLVHLRAKRVVWKTGVILTSEVLYIGNEHMVLQESVGRDKLQVISSPWGWIQRSLAVMEAKGPAHITPYRPVTITVEVPEAFTEPPAEIAKRLLGRLTERVTASGLSVDANQPTVLHAVFKEVKTKIVPHPSVKTRYPRRANDKVAAVVVSLELTWRDAQGRVFADEGTLTAERFGDTAYSYPPDDKVRDALEGQINALTVPFFLPEDPSLPALPVDTTSTDPFAP
jgi:hypothetical protein